MFTITRTPLLIAFLAVLTTLTGCTTQRHTFEGHDPEQVWTAMLAVANTPDYGAGKPNDRWTVRENRVWVDDEANRIEIFRRIERTLYQPASKPQHQDREWKFTVVLEETNPPTAMFKSRNVGVPAHAWNEADRYFADVEEVLGGSASVEAAPAAEAPAAPSAAEPAPE